MVEYINLLGGNPSVFFQQSFSELLAFFKTPGGWIFLGIIAAGLFSASRK